MEPAAEKECSALGGLFQLIINDLKGGTPAWEDFLGKAAKLHSQLKATVAASAAFLDSFQKIADMATSTRGATKDIGTALTRLCLRHRSVEARLKTYTGSLMDSLVMPLQDRLEEWKKVAYQLDKDHAKEYKRVRQEIKKKSSDTLRLQKKVRKAGKGDMQRTLDNALQDVTDRYLLLEETEKQAVRKALIEERSHYCIFVACLKPVVESELAVLQEVTHLQEVVDALTKLTEDPQSLPSASEQVISDIKGSDSGWSFHTPPSSPTSLGSRKSSVCSISSLNSSSSGSTKSHSPSHHSRCRSLSQQPPAGALRLSSVSSQDSGFTSQDTLCMRLPTPPPMELMSQVPNLSEYTNSAAGIVSTTGTPASPYPPAPCVTATWPNLQDTLQFERAAASILKNQRPHTISTAYERAGHNRPALTAQTFQPLTHDFQQEANGICESMDTLTSEDSSFDHSPEEKQYDDDMIAPDKELPPTPTYPPLPDRNVELDKPDVPAKPQFMKTRYSRGVSKLESLVADLSRAVIMPDDQPMYANLAELLPSLVAVDTFPEPPLPTDSAAYNKNAFQKDLAAILAQSLLLQQQLQQNELHSDDSADLPPPPPLASGDESAQKCNSGILPHSTNFHDYQKDNVMTPTTQKRPMSFAGNLQSSPPENKINMGGTLSRSGAQKPPPPIRRSSSLSASSPVQHENSCTKRNRPEPRPPVKSPPISQTDSSLRSRSTGIRASEDMAKSPPLCESFMPVRLSRKDAERSGSSGSPSVSCASASVPCETAETRATAHSQLIQALNARLSVLHHTESTEQQRRNLTIETQSIKGKEQIFATIPSSQNIQEVTGKPPIHSMFGMAHTLAHPPKKSHRTHSLTGNDRESFIQSLNSRFAQSQQAGFRTVQRKPSLQEAPLRVKHTAGHRPLPHHIAHRRASQPSLDQMHEVAMGLASHNEGFNVISVDRSSKQGFLSSLNAKLSQQQPSSQSDRSSIQIDFKHNTSHTRQSIGSLPVCSRSTLDNGHPSTNEAAARVQSWLASRESMDDAACRESLLCQIRQGIPLRKVPSNDRSAPKF